MEGINQNGDEISIDAPMAGQPEDELIIQDVLEGNVDEFERLIKRYQNYVFTVVSRHIPASWVEEVVHDTFVDGYKSLGSYKGRRQLRFWLSTIAIRRCHDFWRQRYHRGQVDGRTITNTVGNQCDEHETRVAANTMPGGMDHQSEVRELLHWSLASLTPDERMAVQMVYLEERSIKETSAMLGWGSIKLKVCLYRARRKLRQILAPLR